MASMKSYIGIFLILFFGWTSNAQQNCNTVNSEPFSVKIIFNVDQSNQRRSNSGRGLFNGWLWGSFGGGIPTTTTPTPFTNGNTVDLSVPPMSCRVNRYDNIQCTGPLIGTTKVENADLCVAVCWQFRTKLNRNCGAVNFDSSTQTCELRDNSNSRQTQSLPGIAYIIPVNCEITGSPNPWTPQPLNSLSKCGITFTPPSIDLTTTRAKNRIVGGTEAKPNSYPWIVSLESGARHFCGGTLIRVSPNVDQSDIVVTASHCMANGVRGMNVVLGAHELNSTTSRGISIQATAYKTHPNYNTETTANDIAIIKLSKPVQFSQIIQPACLPQQGESVKAGDVAVVAGWGTLKEGSVKPSARLMQVPVPVVSDTSCTKAYGRDVDLRYMFCAGYDKGGKDSCQGDSGGPLVFKTANGYTLRGVVSFGEGCARANKPGVYTKASNYRTWIDTTAKSLSSIKN